MSIKKLAPRFFLGAEITNVKVLSSKVDEVITAVNLLTSGTESSAVVLTAGTVSLPSLTFTGDLNTGIYWIGADNIGVTIAGSKVLDISSTGLKTTGTETITSASVTSLAVGLTGSTNPAFVVDSSTASQASGLKIIGAIASGEVAMVTSGSGSNISVTLNAKGAGTIGIGNVSTGVVTITPSVTFGTINTYKGVTTITASATQTQAAGTAITGELNYITVVGTAGDAVTLAAPSLGSKQILKNTATKNVSVFPVAGVSATIDGAAANAAFILEPGQEVTFYGQSGTVYLTREGTSQGTISTVTQGSSITTGVTVNSKVGVITTFSASTAGLASCTFTVTNNKATATSNVRVWIIDYAGTIVTNGVPLIVGTDNHTSTGFDIIYYNAHATQGLSGVLKIGFEIIN